MSRFIKDALRYLHLTHVTVVYTHTAHVNRIYLSHTILCSYAI